MKFYRAHYRTNGGNSAGFSWHTSRREALVALRADYDVDPAEYDHTFEPAARLDVITVTPTRAGIREALGRYASHPDNG